MYSRFAAPFAWILSFFILLFAYIKLVGPLPFSVTSVTTQKTTTFDVVGSGKASAKPDIALVNAGIQVQAAKVKDAQDQINSVINKVSAALKQVGVESKDIQTSNYNISPTYDYSNNTQKIIGYSANTNLQIKVRNLDNVNTVIDTATTNGANQISGLNFDIEDKTEVEDEARQKAVAEAKKKAQQAANIAGFKLGRIINYSENFAGPIRPMPLAVEAADMKVGGVPTQVEPGSSEVTINIMLSYEIN